MPARPPSPGIKPRAGSLQRDSLVRKCNHYDIMIAVQIYAVSFSLFELYRLLIPPCYGPCSTSKYSAMTFSYLRLPATDHSTGYRLPAQLVGEECSAECRLHSGSLGCTGVDCTVARTQAQVYERDTNDVNSCLTTSLCLSSRSSPVSRSPQSPAVARTKGYLSCIFMHVVDLGKSQEHGVMTIFAT